MLALKVCPPRFHATPEVWKFTHHENLRVAREPGVVLPIRLDEPCTLLFDVVVHCGDVRKRIEVGRGGRQ